jgi:histidyl-tRNA synthetase
LYRLPRGTADILPQDQPYWRLVEETVITICKRFGYERIDTPVFEEAGLFERGVGAGTDIVEKEMYTFEDRGGSQLTLRPEGTAPVCRAYLEHGMHNLPQPVKLFYFSTIYRYERPQSGRYREHHQFGFEALGEADPGLDAEVVAMSWQLYKELGLSGLTLHLNSIGCPDCRPGYLESLKTYYEPKQDDICDDCRVRLAKNPLRLLDCKEASCQPIADSAPKSAEHLCPECNSHFAQLKTYLGLMDVPFTENHRLVRGLDYYTRTVFEVQPLEGGAMSTIGGGGRYDGLIEELGGRPTPGIGFATGIERIVLNLQKQNIAPTGNPQPDVFICPLGEEGRELAAKLASDLRAKGMFALTAFGERSLRSQMRQANSRNARYAAIIGEDEVKAGTVTLRDLATGEQQQVETGSLADKLIPADNA